MADMDVDTNNESKGLFAQVQFYVVPTNEFNEDQTEAVGA